MLCIDAMEFISPEDWPRVLSNLKRALNIGGYLYLTVERVGQEELDRAFELGSAQGLPIVRGENILRSHYHFYPSLDQVDNWIKEADLARVEDAHSDHGSYGYYHLLLKKT